MGSKYRAGKKDAAKKERMKQEEEINRAGAADAASEPTQPEEPKGDTFVFPSNVKQIGGVNSGLKIYIEDYAHTYISKLSESTDRADAAAFLIGYRTEVLGEQIVIIMGAVNSPLADSPKDGQAFTKGDWHYVEEAIDTFFPGMQVIGWARIQPGYGLYLSATDISNHYLGFTEKYSVLFLCDPEERLDCFFSWNENQDDLDEADGYFIFYDKNVGMNSYIAEMKKLRKRSMLEAEPVEKVSKSEGRFSRKIEAMREETVRDDDPSDEETPIGKSIDNAKRLAEIGRQKRIISMMTSVSALLFFACVIMGIGLLQSGERISSVETQLNELKSGYNNIVSKINDNTYPAFAAQNTQEIAVEQTDTQDGANGKATESAGETAKTDDQALDEALGIVPVTAPQSVDSKTANDETGTDIDSRAAEADAGDGTEQTGSAAVVPVQVNNRTEQEQTYAAESDKEDNEEADTAKAGQKAQADDTKSSGDSQKYIVKKGDTLSYISQKFYGTVREIDKIMDANGMTDPDRLKVGRTIIIPE